MNYGQTVTEWYPNAQTNQRRSERRTVPLLIDSSLSLFLFFTLWCLFCTQKHVNDIDEAVSKQSNTAQIADLIQFSRN